MPFTDKDLENLKADLMYLTWWDSEVQLTALIKRLETAEKLIEITANEWVDDHTDEEVRKVCKAWRKAAGK
jgi:hypothetical protein